MTRTIETLYGTLTIQDATIDVEGSLVEGIDVTDSNGIFKGAIGYVYTSDSDEKLNIEIDKMYNM